MRFSTCLLLPFVALASLTVPATSQEGSCQADVYWHTTTVQHEISGPSYFSMVNRHVCVSFGCQSACEECGQLDGNGTMWTRCLCDDFGAPDCCTLLWLDTTMGPGFTTSGSCSACNESGACKVVTVLIGHTVTEYGYINRYETSAACQ